MTNYYYLILFLINFFHNLKEEIQIYYPTIFFLNLAILVFEFNLHQYNILSFVTNFFSHRFFYLFFLTKILRSILIIR